ncbi:MAG: hypothetical protein ACOH10_12245 [Rhodoglobus sp.]
MNYLALDPRIGKPMPGDLVWSALPDAPVQEPRPRRSPRALVARLVASVSRTRSVTPDRQRSASRRAAAFAPRPATPHHR